jgi:hypothetical protein
MKAICIGGPHNSEEVDAPDWACEIKFAIIPELTKIFWPQKLDFSNQRIQLYVYKRDKLSERFYFAGTQ